MISYSTMLSTMYWITKNCNWSSLWLRSGQYWTLCFNESKCKYMIISRKRSPITPANFLQLHDIPLQQVDCYKYLGLLLTSNLTWSTHINSICLKAKRILGLLYRRFYANTNQETLKQLYLSHVRLHLDYACQVWDPHLVKDKQTLENIQKFGCRLLHTNRTRAIRTC